MIKKYIFRQSGLTLIEVLATLAISTIIIGIISSVLITTVKYNNKTESHINLRQEANIIITQLRQKHQGEETTYALQYEQFFGTKDDMSEDTIRYKAINNKYFIHDINIEQEDKKINNNNNTDPFQDLLVKFRLTDQQNNNTFEVDTVIEGRRSNNPTVVPEPQEPEVPQEFLQFLKDHNVFLFSKDFEINGTPATIKGITATVVIQNKPKNEQAESEITKQTESVNKTYILGTNVKNAEDKIATPKIPDLNNPSWNTVKHKYIVLADQNIDNNTKYYSEGDYKIKNDASNVIIVSSGSISFSGTNNVSGILFAPNGTVDITGNNTFTGIVIAQKIVVGGNMSVFYDNTLLGDMDLPF